MIKINKAKYKNQISLNFPNRKLWPIDFAKSTITLELIWICNGFFVIINNSLSFPPFSQMGFPWRKFYTVKCVQCYGKRTFSSRHVLTSVAERLRPFWSRVWSKEASRIVFCYLCSRENKNKAFVMVSSYSIYLYYFDLVSREWLGLLWTRVG